MKSVIRRGVDLSESLQIFAAASHTEHGRAESEHLGDNCRADPRPAPVTIARVSSSDHRSMFKPGKALPG